MIKIAILLGAFVDEKSIISTVIGAAIIFIGGLLVSEIKKLNNKLGMINKHNEEIKDIRGTVENHEHRILNLEQPHLGNGDYFERYKTPSL